MGKKNRKRATVVEPQGSSSIGMLQSIKRYDSSDEETKEMPAPKQVAKPAPVVQQKYQPNKPAH